MSKMIITCNAGSSNTKLALFDVNSLECKTHTQTYSEAEIFGWLENIDKQEIAAIGHRVVHGGDRFVEPVIITPEILSELENFIPLAPLHQPASLKLIAELSKLYPKVPQVACFDTAFHHTMSVQEKRFPLLQDYYNNGIKRYGFHGLSYEYIASQLSGYAGEAVAQGRVIVAHLGNGSSMCAMKNLKSQASTMGFSTLDGLMMGTRCGALDAGVILYLLQQQKMDVDEVAKLLYKNSGLLGVSAISADMRELLLSDKPQAKEAIELYCYIAAKQLSGLLPAIGGIDALVFTGGIGEHAEIIRSKICSYIDWLGEFPVYVIPTDEEIVIAKACSLYSNKIIY